MENPEKNRLIQLLRTNHECAGLSDEALHAFLPISTFADFRKGETIFSESQPANSFFIVETGNVRMNFSRRDPVDLGGGEMFGDWAILNKTVRLATAVAKSDATVLEIDAVRFFDHAVVPPAVSLNIVMVIARKLIMRLQSRNMVSTQVLIENGETEQVEFKSTLRKNLKTNAKDPAIELAVLKSIAAFLNSRQGGTLLVGVQDDGNILGISPDEFASPDKYLLHFSHLLENRMGVQATQFIHFDFVKIKDEFVLRVDCDPASEPIFVKDGNSEFFFVRNGPSTLSYSLSQTLNYVRERF